MGKDRESYPPLSSVSQESNVRLGHGQIWRRVDEYIGPKYGIGANPYATFDSSNSTSSVTE
jgi:hypothetical protein